MIILLLIFLLLLSIVGFILFQKRCSSGPCKKCSYFTPDANWYYVRGVCSLKSLDDKYYTWHDSTCDDFDKENKNV